MHRNRTGNVRPGRTFLLLMTFAVGMNGMGGADSPFAGFTDLLPIVDTLDIFLQEHPAGSLIGCLKNAGGGIENSIVLSVTMADQAGASTQQVSLEEVRCFGGDGSLVTARQEMRSAAGTNKWKLSRDSAGTWRIAVTTAGVSNSRPVKAVPENSATLEALYCGIFSNELRVGMAWTDTSLELTSGESVITETRCSETPGDNNGNCWIFVCTNNLLQRQELWKIDRQGETVYRDMYPYVGWKKGLRPRQTPPEEQMPIAFASLFAMMKIEAPRAVKYGRERIAVSFDNGQAIDSSVAVYFRQRGTAFILNPLPDRCSRDDALLSPEERRTFLAATPTLQSTHPKIIGLARSLNRDSLSVCSLISVYNHYVYSTLGKRNSATFSSALETLEAGYGDCGEHAVLLAALLRASGVPGRVVMGIIYSGEGKGYFYHAWVTAYAGRWIFADPSHDCFPAYKDRVPLVIDDDGTRVMTLAKIIGRIKVRYVNR